MRRAEHMPSAMGYCYGVTLAFHEGDIDNSMYAVTQVLSLIIEGIQLKSTPFDNLSNWE